jgi:hypothetical protein
METAVGGIQRDVHDIKGSIDALSIQLNDARRTDWNPIWAASAVLCALIFALWGTSIKPLDDKVSEFYSDTKAHFEGIDKILFDHGRAFFDLKDKYAVTDDHVDRIQQELDKLNQTGPPTVIVKVSDLEQQTSQLRKQLEDVIQNGSQGAREKFAVIQWRLDHPNSH